jgi:hypothetical protein
MDNAALFDGLDSSSPRLKPRLSPQLQAMVAQHRSGPISYDQFRSIVSAEIATRQPAQ